MRKTFLSTAGAIAALAAFLLLVPSLASADAPRKLFRSMKTAMNAQRHNLEIQFVEGVPLAPPSGNPVKVEGVQLVFEGTTVDGAVTLTGKIDLEESHYQSINFGQRHSTLVLVPKNGKGKKIEVTVDAKSKIAKDWTSFVWDGKKYVKVGDYKILKKK